MESAYSQIAAEHYSEQSSGIESPRTSEIARNPKLSENKFLPEFPGFVIGSYRQHLGVNFHLIY